MSARLTEDEYWVACSARDHGSVGKTRHIIFAGGLTTVCGATASHPEIWRGNTTKPDCPICVQRHADRQGATHE